MTIFIFISSSHKGWRLSCGDVQPDYRSPLARVVMLDVLMVSLSRGEFVDRNFRQLERLDITKKEPPNFVT